MSKICPTCGTRNDDRNQECTNPKRQALFPASFSSTAWLGSPPRKNKQATPPRGSGRKPGGSRRTLWHVVAVAMLVVVVSRCFWGTQKIGRVMSGIFKHGKPTLTVTITPKSSKTPTVTTISSTFKLPSSLGVVQAPNGDMIDVNDGSYPPFDTWYDKEAAFKRQAAQALHNGDGAGAISLWQSALNVQSNDTEALIYMENQRIKESGKPYLTLVAGVAFLSSTDVLPESQLQGIYVAQHEYNLSSSPLKLRIFIANSGREVPYASLVAQQIARMARQGQTIVGVVGWLTSSRSHESLSILSSAKLPQVSPQASDDALSGVSSYIFRVVSPNKIQAQAAAQFAIQTLKAKTSVVFLSPQDNYSQNLAHDFEAPFVREGNPQPHEETFTADKTKDFSSLIQDAEKCSSDMFYFTSSSNADASLFQDALPPSGLFATLPMVSGDSGYVAHKNSYNRWYFTDFSYPDKRGLIVGKDYPAFFQNYSTDFNPDGQELQRYTELLNQLSDRESFSITGRRLGSILPYTALGSYSGYTRADDYTILSYDAASSLLAGIQLALAQGKTMPTAQDVANALPQILGNPVLQGVICQTAFDTNHDPANKAVVFLYTSANVHLQMKSVQGSFVKGCS